MMFDDEQDPEHDYTVLLVFPGYGTERENAEAIVEGAIDWLNANKEEPGFRFAPPVSAHLEIVPDIEAARERMEADDTVAAVILHDLEPEERDEFARACDANRVGVCITTEGERKPRRRPPGPMQLSLKSRPGNEVPAHRILGETLTAPIDEEHPDTGHRVSELIAVLALSVMQYHWEHNPPRSLQFLRELERREKAGPDAPPAGPVE